MKVTKYIKELNRLLEHDGDLEIQNIIMDEIICKIKMDGIWYVFNEYGKDDNKGEN